jgi:hypothetical protein
MRTHQEQKAGCEEQKEGRAFRKESRAIKLALSDLVSADRKVGIRFGCVTSHHNSSSNSNNNNNSKDKDA